MSIDSRISRAFHERVGFTLAPNCLVMARVGSHSHGTYLPPTDPTAIDDVDYMGIVVPPLDHYFGLRHFDNWTFKQDELDVVVYSLPKAVNLLLKSNPNILGLLWLREEDYVHRHPVFARLVAQRSLFTTMAVADAFGGYACDQLKRMEAYRPADMDRYESLTNMLAAHFGGVEGLRRIIALNGPDFAAWRQHYNDAHIEHLTDELRQLHRKHFSGYMGEKRKAAVRAHGYDVKNAAHLIRLLRMGTEYLETGQLFVYRTHDAEELKAIKRGEWTLEQVKAEAERWQARLQQAEVEAVARLPKGPPRDRVDALLQSLTLDLHRDRLAPLVLSPMVQV